jgi:hypothetical protein
MKLKAELYIFNKPSTQVLKQLLKRTNIVKEISFNM